MSLRRWAARAGGRLLRALAVYGETLYTVPQPQEPMTVPDDLSELAERWPEAWTHD
ncbi:hypothetical protein EDD27_6882 [Nonomuraea polychroma]|uniref:Uncharacterized protein n=1 Tax=Nonomuraea polychroma TaxID=46176 RepID=A0A438MED2_9ACTN|nr:hypothetical protein [Nonomuraea polychroma]RVX44159.1 hypothetical protein EDD27_6882 [Nonomuraea polychroma]